MASMGPRTTVRLESGASAVGRASQLGSSAIIGDLDDDPLSSMMGEILRDFAADGVLITQREERGEPVVLFAEGACGPAEEALLADAAPGTEWQALDGEPEAAMLTTSTPASGGTITVRTVFRRISDTTRARARVAAARLQPFLQPFARAWLQRRRAQSRVHALTQAIDRADIGVVLVDARGEPTFVNAAARALIAQGDGLRLRGSMLAGSSLADTLRLHAAIEHVISAASPDAAAPVVALPRAARRPLMAAVVAGSAEEAGGAYAPAAIVYLFDPEEDMAALIAPACKLYGLSPVETRLTCLLADGMSLAEAAETMRVREMTARSYLKQIFLKTDTNRQAELVWLMLKSMVRTRNARADAPLTVTLV